MEKVITRTLENFWLIGFPGFYETSFSPRYDEYELRQMMEDNGFVGSDESEEKELEVVMDSFDYDRYCKEVCDDAAEYIMDRIFENVKGLEDSVEYKNISIESPRWYNYSNDKLMIDLTIKDCDKFKEIATKYIKEHEEFVKQYIKDNNTAYDGYIPFYSNDLVEWFGQVFDDDTALSQLFDIMYLNGDDARQCEDWMYEVVSEYVYENQFYNIPEYDEAMCRRREQMTIQERVLAERKEKLDEIMKPSEEPDKYGFYQRRYITYLKRYKDGRKILKRQRANFLKRMKTYSGQELADARRMVNHC